MARTIANTKISFKINPTDPQKLEALPNDSGTKQYQFVSKSTQCYTYSNSARYNIFGVFMEIVPDSEPTNPSTSFGCKISKFILPTDMVECDPAETYLDIENVFSFTSGSLQLGYDDIKKGSSAKFSYSQVHQYHVVSVMMDTAKDPYSYIDDDFMEMLIAQPFRQRTRIRAAYFEKDSYLRYRQGLIKMGETLTSAKFLARITHDSLPGYYLVPDPNDDNGKFGVLYSASFNLFSKTYCQEFYMSELQNMDLNNIGVLKYKLDHRYANMELVRASYHIFIKKVALDVVLEIKRIDVDDDTTVQNTMSLTIPLTKPDEFFHFGFCYGIAPLYYTTDLTMKIRVYDAFFGWHGNNDRIVESQYDVEGGHGAVYRPIHPSAAEVSTIQYSNYDDRAMTTQNPSNLFGLRFMSFTQQYGAFPATRVMKGGPNQNHGGRCMYRGIFQWGSNAYAFQVKRGVSSWNMVWNGAYRARGPENPSSKCLVPYRYLDCLIPAAGYNRDLIVSTSVQNPYPIHRIDEFEGNTPEAVALRTGRVKFTDNLNLDYWIKCPPGCKV